LVQNRVSLALPVMPDVIKMEGMTVKKKSPGVLLLVSLSSPDGSRDSLFLSNYATMMLKDELARVPGVADITPLGLRDYGLRIWADPDRLAALNLTAADVVQALREQNVQAGPLEKDRGLKLPLILKPQGRLADVEEIENVIVKAGPDGSLVRLRDVAR